MALSFMVEYAKSGRSTCKKSKETIPKDALRIGKVVAGREEGETHCQWFLPSPFFEMMRKMRKDSKKVESTDDLDGFGDLTPEDQARLAQMLTDFHHSSVTITPPKKKRAPKADDDGGDDDDDAAPSPKKPKKAKAAPKPKAEPHPAEEVPFSVAGAKALALDLVSKARADGIRLPTDDDVARQACGRIVMAEKGGETVCLGKCLDALAAQFGTTKGQKAMEVANEANRALAEMFKEISGYEFKAQQRQGGITYSKVSKALAACDEAIASGKQAMKLPGVGKGSGAKIDEYLETGFIAKLEEYRATGGV